MDAAQKLELEKQLRQLVARTQANRGVNGITYKINKIVDFVSSLIEYERREKCSHPERETYWDGWETMMRCRICGKTLYHRIGG